MSRGSSGSPLYPNCWALCTLAEPVSLRKGRAGHVTPAASRHRASSSPTSRKAGPQNGAPACAAAGPEVASLTPSTSGHFLRRPLWRPSPVTWIQYSSCQIISTQLIINLDDVAIIFTISLIIHLRFTKWSHEEGFYFPVQITNLKRRWILLQLHIAQISVPLQNAIHVT